MPAIALTLKAGCEARNDLASPRRGPGGSDERTAARHNGLLSPRKTNCCESDQGQGTPLRRTNKMGKLAWIIPGYRGVGGRDNAKEHG
eukprot:1194493-Prorocentrum_minimum.AAC.1